MTVSWNGRWITSYNFTLSWIMGFLVNVNRISVILQRMYATIYLAWILFHVYNYKVYTTFDWPFQAIFMPWTVLIGFIKLFYLFSATFSCNIGLITIVSCRFISTVSFESLDCRLTIREYWRGFELLAEEMYESCRVILERKLLDLVE